MPVYYCKMATESKRPRDPAKAFIKPWKIKPERVANKSLAKGRQKKTTIKQKTQRKIYISDSIKYCKLNGTEYTDCYNYQAATANRRPAIRY